MSEIEEYTFMHRREYIEKTSITKYMYTNKHIYTHSSGGNRYEQWRRIHSKYKKLKIVLEYLRFVKG